MSENPTDVATTDLATLWRNMQQAGGAKAWVTQQLKAGGFLVARESTDGLSRRQLEKYKQQLKAEAAERKRLQHQAWLAYRQQNIVYLGDGVVWSDHWEEDRWDLPDADSRAAENELPALRSPADLAAALNISVPELRWLAFHRDAATQSHYYRFTIPKRSGGEREIWAPHARLKDVQRWVLRHIVEKLPVHGSAHGFLAGRSTRSNAAVHTNAGIVLKMDLRNFFPTVTLPRVKGVFRKAGYREPVALLLALLCTESPREVVEFQGETRYVSLGPRSLPQGAPTSPGITNTLCLRLDRRLEGLARSQGWRYSRYADDLTFSVPAADMPGTETKAGSKNSKKSAAKPVGPRPELLKSLVVRTVANEGFAVHPAKTRILRKGSRQQVTGLVINGDAPPRVPRALRRQLRAALHKLKQGQPLLHGDTTDTVRGWIAYVQMTDREQGEKLLAEFNVATSERV